jgi:hypothetical protein
MRRARSQLTGLKKGIHEIANYRQDSSLNDCKVKLKWKKEIKF